MVRVSHSHHFITHVVFLYNHSFRYAVADNPGLDSINFPTHLATPAYISSVAAIEALVNEITFASLAKQLFPEAPLWELEEEVTERMDLRTRVLLIPYLLFGTSFKRGFQVFQDFSMLVKIRNDFVHYRMDRKEPKYVNDFVQRKIGLPEGQIAPGSWVEKMSSSEGIRWANNVSTRLAHAFRDFVPKESRMFLFSNLADNFREITEEQAMKELDKVKKGLIGT